MAMTDAQRRFAAARDELIAQFYNPFAKMLDAAQAAVVEANRRAEETEAQLEEMRPHWAHGYTSDSQAAQAKTAALSTLWSMLKVDNQTAAVERLQALLDAERLG